MCLPLYALSYPLYIALPGSVCLLPRCPFEDGTNKGFIDGENTLITSMGKGKGTQTMLKYKVTKPES